MRGERGHGGAVIEPLGSGECSASVWVEPNGDILLHTLRSDSIDELASRDKLARVRLRLEPLPPLLAQLRRVGERCLPAPAQGTRQMAEYSEC